MKTIEQKCHRPKGDFSKFLKQLSHFEVASRKKVIVTGGKHCSCHKPTKPKAGK